MSIAVAIGGGRADRIRWSPPISAGACNAPSPSFLGSRVRGRRRPLRHSGLASASLGDEFDEPRTGFQQMAERLESVETTRRQLFGDLAHEIRTPSRYWRPTWRPSRTA